MPFNQKIFMTESQCGNMAQGWNVARDDEITFLVYYEMIGHEMWFWYATQHCGVGTARSNTHQ